MDGYLLTVPKVLYPAASSLKRLLAKNESRNGEHDDESPEVHMNHDISGLPGLCDLARQRNRSRWYNRIRPKRTVTDGRPLHPLSSHIST